MSPSPTDPSNRQATRTYGEAWRGIIKLVRRGSSWSGRERNCAYLNLGDFTATPKFANVSSVTGLDFPDDGRGVAVTDWDQDGDVDVWLRNRTAPRLRLMLNRTNDVNPTASFVGIRLVGVRCNRDAVGARVELVADQPEVRSMVRTVRAGDAFVSQSSKQLHFGVPVDATVQHVVVHWPDGSKQTVANIQTGSTYEIEQGADTARRLPARPPVKLDTAPLIADQPTAAARIVLPGRVAAPRLVGLSTPDTVGRPTLVTLWTSSCPNCRQELTDLTAHATQLRDTGLDVRAICLDSLGDTPTSDTKSSDDFLQKIGFPFPNIPTDEASTSALQAVLGALFGNQTQFVVPMSLLVDADQQLVCIYRGAFSHETFLRDLALLELDDVALRQLSVPLPGTWITKPATRTQFAEFIAGRIWDTHPTESLHYFEAAMLAEPDSSRREQLRVQIAQAHLKTADTFHKRQQFDQADPHIAAAVRLAPDSAESQYAMGVSRHRQHDLAGARKHFRRALEIRPDYEAPQRALQELQDAAAN